MWLKITVPALVTESCKHLTLKGLQIMTLKLDEMRLLNYIMGGVSILQPATRGLLKYFFVWWLCLYFFWHTLNAVCWDFSSCIPFLFELCEMDIQVNLALNIKWQIYGSLEKMLQTSRMRWAHLDLMERNKRAARAVSTRLKDLFNINEHVHLQIHFFFFKYSDEFVWSWTRRSFVFLSHSGGGVAQIPDQLAKLIPSCRPQEPGCLLRPRQPSAGARPRFLKSLHQRWTHQFTHFLFSPALATQSAWSSVLFPRCVETLESSWIWACSRCLLASRPSRSCLAIPLSTSRVSRPRRSTHSHCIFCRWQGDVDGMTLIPHRDWRDYFPVPRQSEQWPNTTLRNIHFIKIPW